MSGLLILILIVGALVVLFTVVLLRSIIAPRRVAALADLYKKNNYPAVIKAAKRIIAKEPRSPEAHYYLGLAYLEQGKAELALMELKTVNSIGIFDGGVSEPVFRKRIAELYARFNQPEEALKEYLLLMKQQPTNPEYPYLAGVLFEQKNRSDRAVNFYKKAIELDARHSYSYHRLGVLLYRAKRPAEAKNMLQQAVRLDADNYQAHYYLGKLLKDNKDYASALKSFDKAQKDTEFKLKSIIERGGCFMNQGDFNRAIIELERAQSLIDNETTSEALYTHYFLGIAYEKMRRIEPAIEQWEKVYSKKPKFQDVAEKLSQYQELRGDDRVKDFMTAGNDQFKEICKAVTLTLGLSVRDIHDIQDGCDVVGYEAQSKWRNARRMPKLLRFLRTTDIVDEAAVRSVHEEIKKQNITRAIIITSSTFSRMAQEFADTRPVELYPTDKLKELLDRCDDLNL